MSVSSSSLKREIDKYQDVSFGSSGSSYKSGEDGTSNSSDSSSSDKHYLSGVPGVPLEEFQEMQHRMASGAGASLFRRSPSPRQDEKEEESIIYSCALEIASTLGRYQILSEFRPRLPKEGERCCSPSFGFGIYTS